MKRFLLLIVFFIGILAISLYRLPKTREKQTLNKEDIKHFIKLKKVAKDSDKRIPTKNIKENSVSEFSSAKSLTAENYLIKKEYSYKEFVAIAKESCKYFQEKKSKKGFRKTRKCDEVKDSAFASQVLNEFVNENIDELNLMLSLTDDTFHNFLFRIFNSVKKNWSKNDSVPEEVFDSIISFAMLKLEKEREYTVVDILLKYLVKNENKLNSLSVYDYVDELEKVQEKTLKDL